MLLSPHEKRIRKRGRENRRDDHAKFHLKCEAHKEMFPTRHIQYGDGDRGKHSRKDHLQAAQCSQRIFSCVALNEDDLKRVEHRATHHQHIAMIEISKSLHWHREKIKPRERGRCAYPGPRAYLLSPKRGKKN